MDGYPFRSHKKFQRLGLCWTRTLRSWQKLFPPDDGLFSPPGSLIRIAMAIRSIVSFACLIAASVAQHFHPKHRDTRYNWASHNRAKVRWPAPCNPPILQSSIAVGSPSRLGLALQPPDTPISNFHFHRLHHRMVTDPLLKPTGVSETRPLVQKDEMRADDGTAELVLLKTAVLPSRPCSALSARNNKRSRRNPAPQIGRARDKASGRYGVASVNLGYQPKTSFPGTFCFSMGFGADSIVLSLACRFVLRHAPVGRAFLPT